MGQSEVLQVMLQNYILEHEFIPNSNPCDVVSPVRLNGVLDDIALSNVGLVVFG